MSLGENIKRLRRDKGWTQGQLARRSNLGLNLISKLERNATDPKISTIYKLINALECSPDALLMDTSKVGTNAILKAVLERTMTLPEKDKVTIIDVVDNYIMAKGIQQQFAEGNGPKVRVWTEAPEEILNKGAG
ncbi:helix-turn-helix domain-containing protein [Thiolapillus brandeum]|nr:helix-turn-helix transcriptional regulator [Thiolapillus brandeum]